MINFATDSRAYTPKKDGHHFKNPAGKGGKVKSPDSAPIDTAHGLHCLTVNLRALVTAAAQCPVSSSRSSTRWFQRQHPTPVLPARCFERPHIDESVLAKHRRELSYVAAIDQVAVLLGAGFERDGAEPVEGVVGVVDCAGCEHGDHDAFGGVQGECVCIELQHTVISSVASVVRIELGLLS